MAGGHPEAAEPWFRNLEDLLRYGFAGGLGIGSFLLLGAEPVPEIITGGIGTTLLWVFGSVLVGSVIYSLHRAVVFPVFRRLILFSIEILDGDLGKSHLLYQGEKTSTQSNRKKAGLYQILIGFFSAWFDQTDLETELDKERWKRRSGEKSGPGLRDWGAQIHLLYCSAWSLIGAIKLNEWYVQSTHDQFHSLLWMLSILLIGAATLSTYRINHLEIDLLTSRVRQARL